MNYTHMTYYALRITIGLIVSSTPLFGMNQITQEDIADTRDGLLSLERFNELKEIPVANNPLAFSNPQTGHCLGDLWPAMTYDQYKHSSQETRTMFSRVVQDAFNITNPQPTPPAQQPTTGYTTAETIRQQNRSSGTVADTVKSFFKTMLPWDQTHGNTVTPINQTLENEISHDPLIASANQGSQNIPGTSVSIGIPSELQTVKNKLSHHQQGSRVAASVLPIATSIVSRVGHHIESNPAAFMAIMPGGIESSNTHSIPAAIETNGTSFAPTHDSPFSLSAGSQVDWTGWGIQHAAKAAYAKYHAKTFASDFIAGKPVINDDAEYQALRNAHKERIRPHFTGTDAEFETFFSTIPTPVQGTVLDRPHTQASLVDGVVAGLNDITRPIANRAALLNTPDVNNAYAASRRINAIDQKPNVIRQMIDTIDQKPTPLQNAIAVLVAVQAECKNSVTPEALLDLESKPDAYLTHLLYTTMNLHDLCKNKNVTIGDLKEYVHATITIVETIGRYTGSQKKSDLDTITQFFQTIKEFDNRIHAHALATSEITGKTIVETVQAFLNNAKNMILKAEKNRPKRFTAALSCIANYIVNDKNLQYSMQQLNWSQQLLLKNSIICNNTNGLHRLIEQITQRTITHKPLIALMQKRMIESISDDEMCETKIDRIIKRCDLLDNDIFNSTYSLNLLNRRDNYAPHTEEYKLIRALHTCQQALIPFRSQLTPKDAKAILPIARQQLAILKQLNHHHTNITIEDFNSYSNTDTLIIRQMKNAIDDSLLTVLQELCGYYIMILESFTSFRTIAGTATDYSDIPVAPQAPTIKEPKPLNIKKKDTRSILDKGLDAIVDAVSNGADYAIEHGPAAAEDVKKRLENAHDAAYSTNGSFLEVATTAAQAFMTTPVAEQATAVIPTPPANPPAFNNDPHKADNRLSEAELQAWRKERGMTAQATAVCVAHPWPGRQDAARSGQDSLKKALAQKVKIQEQQPISLGQAVIATAGAAVSVSPVGMIQHPLQYLLQSPRTIVREDQITYPDLKQPNYQPKVAPSFLSKMQDAYLAYAIRLGYVGDVALIAGTAWMLHTIYTRSSYYQIELLSKVEKACKQSMRNLIAGHASFEIPTLMSCNQLPRLSANKIIELNGALARMRNACKKAQDELQAMTEIPDNYQESATIKLADAAASEVLTMIKKYQGEIKENRGLIDGFVSTSVHHCSKIVRTLVTAN